jgi:hypothetical protein
LTRSATRPEYADVRPRLACLFIAAFVAPLALVSPAQAKRLRFKVVSVKGQQTVSWHDTRTGCGTISRSGSQTISFKSVHPARLSLLRIPRPGKRRGVTYYGVNFIRSNWTLSRTFQSNAPPNCQQSLESYAAQANDCGTRGPFPVGVDIGYRDGAVELRAATDRIVAPYKACEYDGFHEFDLIESKGRLSKRRLTSRRRRTIRVKVSGHLNEPAAESEGSQVTTLKATVKLRRRR